MILGAQELGFFGLFGLLRSLQVKVSCKHVDEIDPSSGGGGSLKVFLRPACCCQKLIVK